MSEPNETISSSSINQDFLAFTPSLAAPLPIVVICSPVTPYLPKLVPPTQSFGLVVPAPVAFPLVTSYSVVIPGSLSKSAVAQ